MHRIHSRAACHECVSFLGALCWAPRPREGERVQECNLPRLHTAVGAFRHSDRRTVFPVSQNPPAPGPPGFSWLP